MKLSTVKSILEDMKQIYPYKDEETDFSQARDMCAMIENGVTLRTRDEKTGVYIEMTKYAEREERI